MGGRDKAPKITQTTFGLPCAAKGAGETEERTLAAKCKWCTNGREESLVGGKKKVDKQ